ncbi:hypothetical protein [Microbacterium hominis]|uniref:hypothetical protein n=1 Tax=Microbacterium hominis TaxID=162426 RepID=UPI001CC2E0C9|nr:hypothetical protein [Microbacterium hominis]
MSTMATTHSNTTAGASEGAQARTATAMTDPMPAALHERCATAAVHSSHGSSRCAITTVGRPLASAPSRVGASA